MHLGPSFPMLIRENSATTPDKIFANKHHYLNYVIEPGNITISHHLPVVIRLNSTNNNPGNGKIYIQYHRPEHF